MPNWLQNQLMRAFRRKDGSQIQLLNECWYIFHKTYGQSNTVQKKENGTNA